MSAASNRYAYLSDRWTLDDGLQFDVFLSALEDVILRTETPLTVGVYGSWGSGKTTMLRMLQDDIERHARETEKPLRTVWFTAWKYDRHEALWRAFILRVVEALYPRDDQGQRKVEGLTEEEARLVAHLDRLAESLYHEVTWQGEATFQVDWGEAAKEGLIKLPFSLLMHLAGLKEIPEALGLNPDLAKIIGRRAQSFYLDQLVSMEQFEDRFRDVLVEALGDEGRLVVFVDDLDRCLPEKAVEVLEALKLFLHVEGTVFVLGMDPEVVRRGIEVHYGFRRAAEGAEAGALPITGDRYLQKIVQLTFNLPSLDARARSKFLAWLQERLPEEEELDEVTREVLARGLQPTPRQAKRAVNTFLLLKHIAQRQEAAGMLPPQSVAWPLLAKTVLIQTQWPELYALWRQIPTLIQTLEQAYRERRWSEKEMLQGTLKRPRAHAASRPDEALEQQGQRIEPQAQGLLAPYLTQPLKYRLLHDLLVYPDKVGEGRSRARFEGLSREELQVYLGLAGAVGEVVERATEATLPGDWLSQLTSGDPALIAEALARLNEREPEEDGPLHRQARQILVQAAQDPDRPPPERANLADAADRLGYRPPDLYTFVPIPNAENPAFYIAKYPVTNEQYRRFLEAEDFADPDLWRGFPKFSEPRKGDLSAIERLGDWGDAGWRWLQKALRDKDLSPDGKVVLPRFWHDPRFGIARPSAPVVGVSWYEANAYARWVGRHWAELEEGQQNAGLQPREIRLPTEAEWVRAAGGLAPEGRYPWDPPSQVTTEVEEVLRRANVGESGIERATPVWMYPLGQGQSHGAWDLGGNVWEWQVSCQDTDRGLLALRGGSWVLESLFGGGRVKVYGAEQLNRRLSHVGFRLLLLG